MNKPRRRLPAVPASIRLLAGTAALVALCLLISEPAALTNFARTAIGMMFR